MSLQQLFTSRKGYDADTFVGQEGKLFYDEATGYLRLGDGSTPGGKVVMNLAIAAYGTTPPNNPYPGELWYNPTTKELWAYYNGQFRGTINAATTSTLGGIKAGPGVVIASDGSLSLDSTGIPFNFGDFYAFTNLGPSDGACLSSINLNQDVNLVSNGDGSINVIGEFNIFRTDADLETALSAVPVLQVSADGDINAKSLDIQETSDLGLMAALNVTINEQGLTKTPAVVTGSVAQFTGRDNRTALIVLDTYGTDTTTGLTGGEITFRTGRGTNNTTTSVTSGDRLGMVTAAGWASNGYGGVGVGGMRIVANENFTSTARGSRVELFAIPNGTVTATTIATVNSNGITLSTGTVLTGNLSGTTVTASQLIKARNYEGGARNAGTLGANGTLTIDFATDHNVLVNLTTTAVIAFANITEGKTVTVLVKNATGQNRAVTLGVVAGNTSNGNAAPNVNDGRTGVLVYRTFGTATTDVYCEFN